MMIGLALKYWIHNWLDWKINRSLTNEPFYFSNELRLFAFPITLYSNKVKLRRWILVGNLFYYLGISGLSLWLIVVIFKNLFGL